MKNTQIAEFSANVQSQVLVTLNHNSAKYPARSIEKVAGNMAGSPVPLFRVPVYCYPNNYKIKCYD